MATLLITGGAGFIGSHTADLALAEGHHVVVVDDWRTGQRHNLPAAHDRLTLVSGDVAADGVLPKLVEEYRPAAIIHLAALVSVAQSLAEPELNFRLNVLATQQVALAARRRVARVVFASSAAVYGDLPELPLHEGLLAAPLSPYGAAKLASEYLLQAAALAGGFRAICLRYFNVYGPRQDPTSPYSGVISIFHRLLQEGRAPTIFGDGEQSRDFVAVADVARANLLAAVHPDLPSGVYNVCTGRQTSLNALDATLRERFVGVAPTRRAAARTGDIRHSLGSPSKLAAATGFCPATPLAEGLARL